MSNIKRIFILFALVVVGMCFSIIFLNPQNKSADMNLQNNDINTAISQLNDFAMDDFIQENLVVNNEKIITNKNCREMLLTDFIQTLDININNDNTININEYSVELTDEYIIRKNSQEYIDIDKVCQKLGFEIVETSNGIELTRAYGSKRLIVSGNLPKNFESDKCVKYGNYSILQYETEKDAETAMKKLQENGNNVTVDYKWQSEPELINADAFIYDQLREAYDKLTTSWGYDYMNFDDYNKYIEDKYDSLDEVVVAVLDSGIREDHNFFKDRIKEGGKNFCPTYDYEDIADDHGHGTHVAGIIAQCTTSNVKILPIKILNNKGEGYTSKILLAYEYVLSLSETMNLKVMNCSFSARVIGTNDSVIRETELIFNKLEQKGISCVVSAGNDSKDASTKRPACIESAITVGSITPIKTLSGFSNYGEGIDIVAPGSFIMSATNKLNFGCTMKSGTSMAAPHISAAIAMLHSDRNNSYSESEIEVVLKNLINEDLGQDGFDTTFGYGQINMKKAIDLDLSEIKKLNVKQVFVQFVKKDGISVAENFAPKVQLSYIGYKSMEQKNSVRFSNFGMQHSLLMANTTLNISGQETWKYKIAGYNVTKTQYEDLYNITYESKDISLQLEDEITYINVFVELAKVKVTVNFIFTDVESCTDFASYGTKLQVSVNTKPQETMHYFTSGYRMEEQVLSFEVLSNQTMTFKIFAEGDSKIEYYYISNTELVNVNRGNTKFYVGLDSNLHGDLVNGLNIVISMLI